MSDDDDEWLLTGLREAAGVLYNATQDKQCFDLALEGPAAGNTGPWDWQVCTEFLGQEVSEVVFGFGLQWAVSAFS